MLLSLLTNLFDRLVIRRASFFYCPSSKYIARSAINAQQAAVGQRREWVWPITRCVRYASRPDTVLQAHASVKRGLRCGHHSINASMQMTGPRGGYLAQSGISKTQELFPPAHDLTWVYPSRVDNEAIYRDRQTAEDISAISSHINGGHHGAHLFRDLGFPSSIVCPTTDKSSPLLSQSFQATGIVLL